MPEPSSPELSLPELAVPERLLPEAGTDVGTGGDHRRKGLGQSLDRIVTVPQQLGRGVDMRRPGARWSGGRRPVADAAVTVS